MDAYAWGFLLIALAFLGLSLFVAVTAAFRAPRLIWLSVLTLLTLPLIGAGAAYFVIDDFLLASDDFGIWRWVPITKSFVYWWMSIFGLLNVFFTLLLGTILGESRFGVENNRLSPENPCGCLPHHTTLPERRSGLNESLDNKDEIDE
jgi:hypothetical protein